MKSKRRQLFSTLFVGLCAAHFSSAATLAAEAFVQLTSLVRDPEILAVNEGDTVTFVWNDPYQPGFTESYTGEWKSPLLHQGQTFSYTFTSPGTYVYRTGYQPGYPYFPGVIRVQAVTGPYPAVWIASPLDHFVVSGYSVIEAATTNSPQLVKSVDFYADGQFIGSATNWPYRVTADFTTNSGTYQITASVVDTVGHTNASAPISITFDGQQLFHPWRLPQGQTVFFRSIAGGDWCILWSADMKTWNPRPIGAIVGNSVVVDESTTNVVQRFYKLQYCL